ncbi:lichenicidin A2 family type 2 lantibiotic [Proteiniborus sp.]|uniref:mersacidin family lantibiotic n=1 Tax=Proteiniborus sp. TaxID=2079015 RepID=UPI003319D1A4
MNDKFLMEYDSRFVGKAFEELSLEEMALSQGCGDIVPMSGPPCFLITAGSALLITFWLCQNN